MLRYCKIGIRIPLLWFFCLFFSGFLCAQKGSEEDRIQALLDKVEKENRFVDDLLENNLSNLPVGIRKTINGTTVTIAIDSAVITPQGMIINAFTQMKFPGNSAFIFFALKGAILTPSGLSPAGSTRLEMLNETRIHFSEQADLILPANGRNFIEWDCYGFRSVNFNGIFEFSPDIFIPDGTSGTRVKAEFEINTTDPKNMIVSTSISPFRIRGLRDMAFTVRDAVIDMSDYANCSGFVLPAGYIDVFRDAPQLWRGFFIKEVSVLLPSELSSNGVRSQITAHDLLIDDYGISGHFAAGNILSIENGNASGWPFSIDRLDISLSQNRIIAGDMSGSMGIPFLGNDTLGYAAQIISNNNGLDYSFSLGGLPAKEFACPLGGKVRLDEGCIFNLRIVNGKFIPSAILNGKMSLSADVVNIPELRFEQLQLSAESPYILGGKFDTSGGPDIRLAGFELSINDISLAINSGRLSLGFDTYIALMGKSDKGLSGSSRIFLNAHASVDGNQRQSWEYDGSRIENIRVDGSVSVFSVSGEAAVFKNDPVFGNGIKGKLELTAGSLIKNVKAELAFGNKADFKYWLARLNLPGNLPIGPVVNLSSLSGGAYSNMERVNLLDAHSEYIPKKDAGLGFLAGALLAVKNENVFNADILFEIAINKNGGLKFVRFSGDGQFLSKPGKNNRVVKMDGKMLMLYDNVNRTFHANLSVFLNVGNAIRGVGPQDLLGEAVIHCDPVDWYVYIGRPSSPLGVNVLGLAKAQTYFMAGTKIENMPLPPSEVASIITGIDLDFMKGERGAATGRGVAFGLQLKASAGIGQNSGFVYAYFSAGAGADIMLQDYGALYCEGRSGPIGINGWYASGQAYAYLTGKIGIRVKKAEFDIMDVAAAMLLQAKMPNPAWFRGAIAARYSVLGGLVKGKVNVSIVLGQECIPIDNSNEVLNDLKVIGEIVPSDGSSEVDVIAAPQVSFNTAVEKELSMLSLKDEYTFYRVKLDQFSLETSDKKKLEGVISWNANHDMATLKLRDILPGRQEITATVAIHIEKKTPAGWVTVSAEPEKRTLKFTTGDEPKSISDSYVAYSYPLKNQYNFYKSEYPKGYLKLAYGLPNIFRRESDGITWEYLARFKTNGKSTDMSLNYNAELAMIEFALPDLQTSAIYDLEFIKRPVKTGTDDRNLKRTSSLVSTGNSQDSVSVSSTQISGTIAADTETRLYSLSFRTSMFTTFLQKMESVPLWEDLRGVDDERDFKTLKSILYRKGKLAETFDKYEIEGAAISTGPLVNCEATMENLWLTSYADPIVYSVSRTTNITLSRDINVLGLFPLKAVFMSNGNSDNYLLSANTASAKNGDVYFVYEVAVYVCQDYSDYVRKAVALYLNTNTEPPFAIQRLLVNKLQDLWAGQYPFKVGYKLPGSYSYNTSKTYEFTQK